LLAVEVVLVAVLVPAAKAEPEASRLRAAAATTSLNCFMGVSPMPPPCLRRTEIERDGSACACDGLHHLGYWRRPCPALAQRVATAGPASSDAFRDHP
jgi:hypothetical protein